MFFGLLTDPDDHKPEKPKSSVDEFSSSIDSAIYVGRRDVAEDDKTKEESDNK